MQPLNSRTAPRFSSLKTIMRVRGSITCSIVARSALSLRRTFSFAEDGSYFSTFTRSLRNLIHHLKKTSRMTLAQSRTHLYFAIKSTLE